MAKKIFGLASVKIGAIESDGGMATVLSAVGETVSETAVMNMEDNTNTNFTIEESDSPVESIVSEAGALTFSWSSYKVDYGNLAALLGGTGQAYAAAGRILTLGAITGGSGYASATYTNVPLTGGTGSGATADIVVAGGAVTGVTLVSGGSGYTAGNTLSAAAADLGGAGSGFSIPASTVGTLVSERWEAPDQFPEIERSIELTDKKGNVVKIPRAKIASKLGLSFSKTSLGRLDMVATVLQPEKVTEKRLTIEFADPA